MIIRIVVAGLILLGLYSDVTEMSDACSETVQYSERHAIKRARGLYDSRALGAVRDISRIAKIDMPYVCEFDAGKDPATYASTHSVNGGVIRFVFFARGSLRAFSDTGLRGVTAHEIAHFVRGPNKAVSARRFYEEEKAVDNLAARWVGADVVAQGLAEQLLIIEDAAGKVDPELRNIVAERVNVLLAR